MKLEGKSAIVTGSGRGIGRAIALELAKEGADILINDVIEHESVKETIGQIGKMDRKAIFYKADVSKEDEVVGMVQAAINTFGKLDILVSNAGKSSPGMLHKMTLEKWYEVINSHLTGAFLTTREAAKHMRDRKSGKIVYISSIGGSEGTIGQCNYGAAKGGLFGLMKCAAKELARYSINVNAVCPGVVETDMTAKILADEKFRNLTVSRVLLGKVAQPENIAPLCVFLCSEEGSYIHAQSIYIDGGMYGV